MLNKKMRMKTMWAGVLSLAVLASCSQEELVTTNENNGNGEEQTWCTDVKLILPSVAGTGRVATRGVRDTQNEGFADGEDYEYHVNNNECYFVFFDENRRRMGQVSGTDIKWNSPDGNGTDNVTRTGTVILKSTIQPSYMVCFLNAHTTLRSQLSSMNLTALKEAHALEGMKGDKDAMKNYFARTTSNGGFFMCNSSYLDKNGNRVQEIDIKDYVYKVEGSSSSSSKGTVPVYVERAVAKTTVSITADNAQGDGANTWYKLSSPNITEEDLTATTVEFGVRFMGWGLNATNKSFVPLKNIPQNTGDWSFSDIIWNSFEHGRSYWEEDGNYNVNNGLYPENTDFDGTNFRNEANQVLNYYSLNKCTNSFGDNNAEYCFANTMTNELHTRYSAITHVIVKAQYTDNAGKAATSNVYQFGNQIYSEEALIKAIKLLAVDYLADDKKGKGWADTDFEITNNTGDYNGRKDVHAIVSLTETGQAKIKEGFASHATNMNPLLFGELTLWIYPQGECYYTIPIKHFTLSKGETGYFGVVRNHWYQINISAISGFGHPTSPDKPIIPEPIEEDEYMLSCEINVLAWGKVTQDATVGGNEDWQ